MASKKLKIKKIGTGSLAKTMAAIYGTIGLLFGIFMIIWGIATRRAGMDIVGVILIIAYPIMGLVLGALIAWAYNFAAARIGGIELEVG